MGNRTNSRLEELERQLEQNKRELEELIAQEKAAEELERDNWILERIDALLILVPEHSRTSCSDDHPNNTGRCNRCNIIYAKEAGIVNFDMELWFEQKDY